MDLSADYDDEVDNLITSVDIFNDSKELLTNYDNLKKNNISRPILSKYERSTIIGIRAQQISNGANVLVDVPKHMSNSIEIAEYELNKRKTPFIVRRKIGKVFEYWKIEDLSYQYK